MKKNAILGAILCLLSVGVIVAQQAPATPANAAGTWEATIHRSEGKTVEKLILQQDGTEVTGKLQTSRGEFPVTGRVLGRVLRANVNAGELTYHIHASVHVNGADMDGTIRLGGKDEFLWSARRSK